MSNPRSLDGEETTPASVETSASVSGDGWSPAVVDHDDRLILWMLRQEPAKRLEALQDFVDGIVALRHAKKITR